MIDSTTESGQADLEEEDGGGEVLGVSVSVTELDGRWHNTSVMIPEPLMTVEAIADALIQCIIGVAAARSPHTLISLQQRLMSWGSGTD